MTQQLSENLTYKRTLSASNTLIIASGQVVSNISDCGGMQVRGLLFPANWTPCNVSLQGYIIPSGQFYAISNIDGSAFAATATTNQWLPILPYLTDSVPYLRISTSVPQAQNVSVIVALEPLYQGVHG